MIHEVVSFLVVVCWGLTSLLNIWGHIATMPAWSSGTLTNVLPHRNAMLRTQDMTTRPITVYRHRADLSLCYPLMWNVTLKYTTMWCCIIFFQSLCGDLGVTGSELMDVIYSCSGPVRDAVHWILYGTDTQGMLIMFNKIRIDWLIH